VNPDTEQVGYHAQSVTKEQQARAEALVRRMCPDPDPVLQALGLVEPRTAVRQTAGPPPPGVEVCKRGHVRTEENTFTRVKRGYPCRECRDCIRARKQAPAWTPDTHCRNGHERTPDNTYTGSDGIRRCRTCQTNSDRARRQREREARQGAQ
jgi:hypothetical protein